MEESREGTVAPPVSPRSVTMALLSLKLKGGIMSSCLLEAACSIQGGRFLSPRDLVCCEFFIDRWCLKHSSTKKNLLSWVGMQVAFLGLMFMRDDIFSVNTETLSPRDSSKCAFPLVWVFIGVQCM